MYFSLVIAGIFLLLCWIYNRLYYTKNCPPLPPGPSIWRIIPILLNPSIGLEKKILRIFTNYKPMGYFGLGSFKVLLLNDQEILNEALKEDVFSGRPNYEVMRGRLEGMKSGFGFNDGESFKERKRFLLRHLRELGMGKNSTMDKIVNFEAQDIYQYVLENLNKPMSMSHRFNIASFNCIFLPLAGRRFEHDDPMAQTIIKNTERFLGRDWKSIITLFCYPLVEMFPNFFEKELLNEHLNIPDTYFRSVIDEHLLTYDETKKRDFIDCWIYQMKQPSGKNLATDNGVNGLTCIMTDLFIAGTDTTGTALNWLLLFLIRYPHIQRKIQNEIDYVIGLNRIPHFEDKERMPYTETVLLENLRYSSFLPFAVPHRLKEDTDFHGYFIPKDTTVIPHLYSIHHDKCWSDPQNFCPERFLITDGRINKNLGFVPFSKGKRACPGENLAHREMFVFITTLLQRFTFECVSNEEPPTMQSQCHISTLTPHPYNVVSRLRNSKY